MSSNLMINLTEQEMLELWKTRLRLLPARRECSIERDDGIDVDAVMLVDIREWYSQLLATANVEWLPVEDLSLVLKATTDEEGVVTVQLPASCVRPVEWKLDGWSHSVTQFFMPNSFKAMCQGNIYLRGDPVSPAAVLHDNVMKLYAVPPGSSGVVTMARCVVYSDDGTYSFSQMALHTMHDYMMRQS